MLLRVYTFFKNVSLKKFLSVEIQKRLHDQKSLQYSIGLGSIVVISLLCYLFSDIIGYHSVALILLLAVSILAMLLETWPIIVTAVASALIWNFLFLQPKETFSIHTPQDVLLFLMYFVIVVMNAVFTSQLRNMEELSREKRARENTLQLYNTLLNSLSHELKTPIAAIIGSVDTLKTNSEKLTEVNKKDLVQEIEIAGYRLYRQVNNLLSMSRLESKFFKLQRDWYDINELIHKMVSRNFSTDTSHTIIYHENENLPLFHIDGLLLEQVIQNIIHNAIQYTPPGTVVKISAAARNENLLIEIQDNGPGFPEDKLEQVFEKFYRLPNSATGGTGLGLSIVRGFVQAQNGKIQLENLPDGGAKFTIIIPAETNTFTPEADE